MELITIVIESDRDTPIYNRLRNSPSSFTDQELRWIMRMYEGRQPRGRNAQLPAMAFLVLESRRKPVPHRRQDRHKTR